METTILVVEDDAMLREVLCTLLQRKGYTPLAASDCREAEEAFFRQPALVLLDVGLPDGDGFSLCRKWRAEGVETPHTFSDCL